MKKLLILLPLMFASCAYLDFGDSDRGSSWEAHSFITEWLKAAPEEDPENPGYTKDGDKIVSPEVAATYTVPDIHAGMAWVDGDEQRITPTLNIELAEFKVPYIRWLSLQAGAGTDEVHLYLGKRFTSIVETTAGPMIVRRVDENDWVLGVQWTLIKF